MSQLTGFPGVSPLKAKTANHTVDKTDQGRVINVVATNTVTISLPSAGTLGNGFHTYIRRDPASDSDVEIGVPISSTLTEDGETCEIVCDGSTYHELKRGTGGGSSGLPAGGSLGEIIYKTSTNTGAADWSQRDYWAHEYGAVGDGVTDDTTALQAALTAAGDAGGGTVRLQSLTYLTDSLTIPAKVRLVGMAEDTELKRKSGAGTNTACLVLTGGSGIGYNAVECLTVNGNKAANAGAGIGIKFSGTYRGKIHTVRVTSCGEDGIVVADDGSEQARECVIDTVTSESNTSDGIFVDYGAYDTIIHVVECGNNGNHGINVSIGAGTRMFGVACWYNTVDGVNLYHCSRIHGCNIRLERNGRHGIKISSGRQILLTSLTAYYNSSTDAVGTGKNTYSGILLNGGDTYDGLTGCKWITLQGKSGDDNINGSYTGLPYQKYGIEETGGGTFVDCYYYVDTDGNATGSYSLVSGKLFGGYGDKIVTTSTIKSPVFEGAAGSVSVQGDTGVKLSNAATVNWSADSTYYGTKDVGLRRNAADVLQITDGATTSGLGSLYCEYVNTISTSTLPYITGGSASNSNLVLTSTINATVGGAISMQPNGGRVGIGTGTPGALIHVTGSSDDLYSGAFINTGSTGKSYGVNIQAGTSASDFAFRVKTKDDNDRFNVRGDGYCGIGTIYPAQLLHVKGDNPRIRVEQSSLDTQYAILEMGDITATYPLMRLMLEGSSAGTLITGSLAGAAILAAVTANAVQIGTNNTARITVLSDGKVGISTASPGYPLEVTGNAYFSADVSALTFTDRP